MTVEQFVSVIQSQGWRVRLQGGEYRAQCPAHGKRGESDLNLAIGAGANGGIVCTCHSHRCKAEQVAAAVGVPMSELMPPGKANGVQPSEARVVQRYRYDDAKGEQLFQVWRYEPKDFKPHHLDSSGQWKAGYGTESRPLYHLPEILAADPKEPIFLCAGEKDADNLRRLGLVATTNPGGESVQWSRRPEWTEPLKGRRCIVVEDVDPVNPRTGKRAGEEHGREVFAALTEAGIHAKRLRLPGLAEGEDASDWIARGGTAEQLRQMAKPEPSPMLAKILTRQELKQQEPEEWQIEGLFFEQSMVEIFGPTNQGKTFLAIDLCLNTVCGSNWWGHQILKPGCVVYVNADGGRKFRDRILAWEELNGDEASFEFYTYPEAVRLHDAGEMAKFAHMLRDLEHPPAVVVFDTLSRCLAGVNENLQEEMSLVVDHVTALKLEFGCTPILLHHTNKQGQQERGSTVVGAAADTLIRVDQAEDGLITVKCDKQRDWERFADLHFRLERAETVPSAYLMQASLEPGARRHEARNAREEWVLSILRDAGAGLTQEEIRARTPGYSQASVSRYLKDLQTAGLIVVDRHSNPSQPAVYFYRTDAE